MEEIGTSCKFIRQVCGYPPSHLSEPLCGGLVVVFTEGRHPGDGCLERGMTCIVYIITAYTTTAMYLYYALLAEIDWYRSRLIQQRQHVRRSCRRPLHVLST